MHGPPLTSAEITASLDRKVSHLESLGLDRPTATRVLATEYGIPLQRLATVLAQEVERR